jgi:hypothetical protein
MNIVCLSMWQPWAQLYCLRHKRIETRGWSAMNRGIEHGDMILIHATKKRDAEVLNACLNFGLYPDGLFFGGLIGAVIFDKEMRFTENTYIEVGEKENSYGNFAPGRYGFVAKDAVLARVPFPCKGSRLGFFPVPPAAQDWLNTIIRFEGTMMRCIT